MKDQTDRSGGVMVASIGEGTAIFLMRQPDGSTRKVMSRLESYVRFEELAKNPDVVACKWVPEQLMSYQLLRTAQCAGVACVDRCVHPGCICNPDTSTCV
jgi:hypothetical protein